MRTIIACTDFSPAARSAMFYAAALADSLKARLVLVSAYLPEPVIITDTAIIATTEDLHKVNEDQLKHEVSILHAPHDLPVVIHSREGNAVDMILEAAENWHAGMIVTGMKISGKNMRRIFGSTVTELVRKSKWPVIVVPENASFEKPSTIALAWESDIVKDTDPVLLSALQLLGDTFHASLFLVHVSRNEYKEAFAVLNRPFKLQSMLKTLQPELENIHGKDLAKVLGEFIWENEVKMLALIPHKHSLLERMFLASSTKKLVFESAVPVLVLPGIHLEKH